MKKISLRKEAKEELYMEKKDAALVEMPLMKH